MLSSYGGNTTIRAPIFCATSDNPTSKGSPRKDTGPGDLKEHLNIVFAVIEKPAISLLENDHGVVPSSTGQYHMSCCDHTSRGPVGYLLLTSLH